jgi:hypothetical protein
MRGAKMAIDEIDSYFIDQEKILNIVPTDVKRAERDLEIIGEAIN